MTHSIIPNSPEDIQEQLELRASGLIYRQKHGWISRNAIKEIIAEVVDVTERQRFKTALNKYLKMKPINERAA